MEPMEFIKQWMYRPNFEGKCLHCKHSIALHNCHFPHTCIICKIDDPKDNHEYQFSGKMEATI